jgi:short-subunit dehydrogenase
MASCRGPTCILITGASGGIGAALARLYAAPGMTLILQGRHRARLDQLQSVCEDRGARVERCILELEDLNAVIERISALADRYRIDLVIVNAGVTHHIGTTNAGESWVDIERVMTINARAALATVTAVLPAMRHRGAGQIALISSLSAWYGVPLTPAYCASKAALKAYGEALGGWLAPEGIGVTVVLPGFVASAMSEQFPGPRPFLLTADQAALRMRRGLERRRARISFPLPLVLGMQCLAVLPARWSRWILTRLGYAGA